MLAQASRLQYYRRIFSAYLLPDKSHLSFWHDQPQANPNAFGAGLGEYYMPFLEKADYPGPYDSAGIPMLNYQGEIGLQYNPIAIAQWGLGNYNQFRRSGDQHRKRKFQMAADWMCAHLERNSADVWVWNHYFNWEYRTPLRAPWCSGLAQGQGISLLARAHLETGDLQYFETAERAFDSFRKSTSEGGVSFTDGSGDLWFEEYIVSPPTHILNGFIWAAWGVYDYFLATKEAAAERLFAMAIHTLHANLEKFDLGFWSLYEQSGTWLPMVASPFYHQLHVVQLRVMHRLTGDEYFSRVADRWEAYGRSFSKRTRALCYKGAFKLCHY